MLIKIFVILMLVAIFVSLFSALVFLFRNKGQGTRTAQALTWRIGLSLTLFILLMAGFYFGIIPPEGFLQYAKIAGFRHAAPDILGRCSGNCSAVQGCTNVARGQEPEATRRCSRRLFPTPPYLLRPWSRTSGIPCGRPPRPYLCPPGTE